MAANKLFNFGPVALTATYTTNILNPPTATGGTNGGSSPMYIVLKKIRVTNKTNASHTFRLYKGATGANAAGTELAYDKVVAANAEVEIFGLMRFDSTDFLVGGADALTSLTIEGEGEIGVSG